MILFTGDVGRGFYVIVNGTINIIIGKRDEFGKLVDEKIVNEMKVFFNMYYHFIYHFVLFTAYTQIITYITTIDHIHIRNLADRFYYRLYIPPFLIWRSTMTSLTPLL